MKEPVTDIKDVLRSLEKSVSSLRKTVSMQGAEIDRLNRLDTKHQKDLHDAKVKISALENENKELKKRLSKYEKPEKDSHNSSVPPSQEPIKSKVVRHTKSLRKSSGKKSGGQAGHKGHTLLTSKTPDETVQHKACFCEKCGRPIDDMAVRKIRKTQFFDIEMPKLKVTEHQYLERVCTCGHHNRAGAPNCRTAYGDNLRAIIVYLTHVQCLSWERAAEAVSDLFHCKISQGTVKNILREVGEKADAVYEEIRNRVEHSPVVGADETGASVGKELHWNWIFQTELLTYVFQKKSRGMAAIDDKFPKGLPNSTLVTDRHGSYFRMNVKKHQVCLAHLLRNAEYLNELDEKQNWSRRFQEYIRKAIELRKAGNATARRIKSLQNKMNALLKENLQDLHKDFETFKKGIFKVRDYLFTFLYDPSVPYDNNASERGVRKIKVKQKVSGCFRTDVGADIFAKIHSIAETAKKNNQSKFEAILAICQ